MYLPPNVAAVLQRYQEEWPVKVGALARELGIQVVECDLPNNISGMLVRGHGEEQKWIIRVNKRNSRQRQRFTVAHEIAHYLLHIEEIGREITDDTFYRSELSDEREREANRLAAEILMPWSLIRKAIHDGIKSPDRLAESFGVSSAAMHVRLGLPT